VRILIALVVIVAACGGAQRPRSTGMKELAAEIDAESADLARIIRDLRGDCPRMAREMKALFARMKTSFDRAHTAQKDPALAKELTTHMRAYDDVAKQRGAQMDADLESNPACLSDASVRDAMMTMPNL
jgi:phage-related minor tail protein